HHRGRVEVVPTGSRGVYRLTALGWAGVIETPARRLEVRPKVPLRHLLDLLPDGDPLPEPTAESPGGGDGLPDPFAGPRSELHAAGPPAGPPGGPAERPARPPSPQGRLDIAERARAPLGPRDRLACRYDAFTPDVPVNQIAKAAAERALFSPFIGADVRHRLV